MREAIATATGRGRWRRRRAARIALALGLVVSAPLVDSRDRDDGNPPARGGTAATDEPADGDDTLYGHSPTSGTRGDDEPGTAGADGRALTGRNVRMVPVPLADAGVADLLDVGDLVDLVAVGPGPPGPPSDTHVGPAEDVVVVARNARIRSTPDERSGTRSILVEVPESAAAGLAATAAGTPLAVVVHG